MTPVLETERLRLRPLAMEDAEQIQRIFPRWEIVQYLAAVVPWPYPADGALHYIRDVALPGTEKGAEWHWTIRAKSEPETIIGCIGLMRIPEQNRGFWMVPECRGRGYMIEACEAVNAFWFDVLGEPVLQAPKAAANIASRRVSEKLGMRLVKTFTRDYVSGALPAELWEITAAEWRRRRERA